MQIPEKVEMNVVQGLVLNNAGQWVSIEEALLDEVKIRHHLEAGEIFDNGRWTPLFERAPAPGPAAGPERDPDDGEYDLDYTDTSGLLVEQRDTKAFEIVEASETQAVQSTEGAADQEAPSSGQEVDDGTTPIAIEDDDAAGMYQKPPDTVAVEFAQNPGSAPAEAPPRAAAGGGDLPSPIEAPFPVEQPPDGATLSHMPPSPPSTTDEEWEHAIARNRLVLVIVVSLLSILIGAGVVFLFLR
jgi:hypothetical protein